MSKTPQTWTVTDVADRFAEAVFTLRRLPPVKVPGYFNTWPDMVRTTAEKLQEEKLPKRLGPPTPDAIDRMEETIGWTCWLEDEMERKIVWLRAERVYWKQICWRLGCGRTTAHHTYRVALLKIAMRLNAGRGGR